MPGRVRGQTDWAEIPALSATSCLTLVKSLNLSEPQFPPLQNGGDNTTSQEAHMWHLGIPRSARWCKLGRTGTAPGTGPVLFAHWLSFSDFIFSRTW